MFPEDELNTRPDNSAGTLSELTRRDFTQNYVASLTSAALYRRGKEFDVQALTKVTNVKPIRNKRQPEKSKAQPGALFRYANKLSDATILKAITSFYVDDKPIPLICSELGAELKDVHHAIRFANQHVVNVAREAGLLKHKGTKKPPTLASLEKEKRMRG